MTTLNRKRLKTIQGRVKRIIREQRGVRPSNLIWISAVVPSDGVKRVLGEHGFPLSEKNVVQLVKLFPDVASLVISYVVNPLTDWDAPSELHLRVGDLVPPADLRETLS